MWILLVDLLSLHHDTIYLAFRIVVQVHAHSHSALVRHRFHRVVKVIVC